MITRAHIIALVGAAGTAGLLSWLPADAEDKSTIPLPPDTASSEAAGRNSENGYSVLGKGPVHEAFAQPYRKDPGPTPVVPRKPPPPIPEEPPDQKPQGNNVQWIPGYWAWDNQKNDFIWVSGLWRVPPPGRQWVPGYWADADGGQRWIPGYWADAKQAQSGALPPEAGYLPEPPASLDYGPGVPPPDDNSIYEPGYWDYQSSGYVWRPGFWTTGYPDWVWNPPSYEWTPAGCTYVGGYWDYPLANRGLLFAPVYFHRPLWENPSWCFRPNCVFGVGGLLSALFCRPDCCSYYYGDYFSPACAGLGFRPWCGYGWHGNGFDPLFNHYGWANRFHPGWYNRLHSDFLARQNGLLPAPAGTLARQTALAALPGGGRFPRTVTPLQQFRGNGVQLTRLDPAQLTQQRAAAGQLRTLANQRAHLERAAAAGTLGTALSGRSGVPGGRSSFGNVRTGQAGAAALGPSLGNRPGNGTVIGRTGSQRLFSPGFGRSASRFSPQGGLSPFRQGSRSNSFFRAPNSRAWSSPGSSYRSRSVSRSLPSYQRGNASFRRGRAPSFHRAATSFRGGGGHFGGAGHGGGSRGGGGHSGGGHGGGGHHR